MQNKITHNKLNTKSHPTFIRLLFTILIIMAIIIVGFIIIKTTGLWDKINSIEKIKKIVDSGGVFSFIVFIIFQILQTTILQVPSIIITLAGTVIFGRWIAFILSFVAIIVGSLLMFLIGRKFGRKFLNWLVGADSADHWIDRMTNGKYLFFLMMLFPLFPDDILCVVAGVTNMSFGFFLTTNIIARALGIGCTVFLGSGTVIPFTGWGLIVWGLILLVVVALFYVSIKYQNKIDEIIKSFSKKKM